MNTYISPKAFVATYDPDSDASPWELLEQYYESVKLSGELTGYNGGRAGSSAVASHMGLPRERIRTWVDEGGKPDPQRGLERAHEHGWIDVDPRSATMEGLSRLVAQVFAGGSITDRNYSTSFAMPSEDVTKRTIEACGLVDAEYEIIRNDDSSRATELRIRPDGAILGRVLSVLGAPIGHKATDDEISLPPYLDDVGKHLRTDFARTYILNRGIAFDKKDTLSIKEERPQSFRDDLAAFLEDTLDETVTSGERTITLSADAARTLQ